MRRTLARYLNLAFIQTLRFLTFHNKTNTQAAVVDLNFRVGSTLPVPVCTVSPGHWVNKADTQSLTRSDFSLNLLLLVRGA